MLRVICCAEPSGCIIVSRASVTIRLRVSTIHEPRACGEFVHFGIL